MSVQITANAIISIERTHRENMMLKADINYMSSLMFNRMPYSQTGDSFLFESLDIAYLTETLILLIDETKKLMKEKTLLFDDFDEEEYK